MHGGAVLAVRDKRVSLSTSRISLRRLHATARCALPLQLLLVINSSRLILLTYDFERRRRALELVLDLAADGFAAMGSRGFCTGVEGSAVWESTESHARRHHSSRMIALRS